MLPPKCYEPLPSSTFFLIAQIPNRYLLGAAGRDLSILLKRNYNRRNLQKTKKINRIFVNLESESFCLNGEFGRKSYKQLEIELFSK